MTGSQVWIGLGLGAVAAWGSAVAVFFVAARRGNDAAGLRDAMRLVPDSIGLLRRLLADRSLPRGVRIRVGLLVVYLASPIDLVPDFIPVIGFADDVILIGWVLRSATRHAGAEALDRHWRGSEDGLRTLKRLVGVD